MKPVAIILTLALVSIAGGIGFLLGRRSTAEIAAVEKSVEPEIAGLSAENARLQSAIQAARKPSPEEVAPIPVDVKPPGKLDAWRAFSELKKQNLVMLNGTLLYDGKITVTFVKLFGLSSAETEALQEAINAGRRKSEALALANTTAEVTGDALVVSIKPFEGGGEIYDDVLDAFAQTLGPERNAAFLSMGSDHLGSTFSHFGAEQRTITVTREFSSSDKRLMFIVKDHHKRGGGISGANNGRTWDVKYLTETYRPLAPYLSQISSLPVKTVPEPK